MNDFDKECEQLSVWTRTLLATVEDCVPQMRKALDPSSRLPDNCPSRASMAELIFRQVRGKLDEVVDCAQKVEAAIWKSGN